MKTKQSQINYLFFGFLFVFLLGLTFSHYIRTGDSIWGAPLFFLLYAFGQALLEVFCFMLFGYLLHRWTPRWVFKLYIGLSFALLLAHFTNYIFVRLMDASISYLFKFFLGCGIEQFLVVFSATNLNSGMIAIIIGSIIAVPLLGIGFYWLTQKVSLKKPLLLTQKQILIAVASLSMILLGLDFAAKPYLTRSLYDKYKKTLPLGSTFLSPASEQISLPAPIRHSRSESDVQKAIDQNSFAVQDRPNIFLFVTEALRQDYINSETAPNLTRFARENISSDSTFSNANTTNLSWFSIFHSDYPYYWTEIRDSWTKGSAPLQILKKMGYRIRVYSGADLSYFNMDQIVFGKDRKLADSIKEFSSAKFESCERDRLAIEALTKDASQEPSGTIFILFLDSTHSEYSAPKDFIHPFLPQAESVDYFSIGQSSDSLELLKNRYRNSIYWIDHLIGECFDKLREKNIYDPSMIVLTGDHGEEFYEDGALFHGTHLNVWQTKIPIYYKIPLSHPESHSIMSTHIDIFPTLLHLLTGQSKWDSYFDGQSLFAKDRWSYALTVQHNGHNAPNEFSLSDGQMKLYARFPLSRSAQDIELLSLMNFDGKEIESSKETVQAHFSKAFDHMRETQNSFDGAPKQILGE